MLLVGAAALVLLVQVCTIHLECSQCFTLTFVIYSGYIPSSQFVHSLGSMKPLCRDQPETLTQGYYPRVDSPVIYAAHRRRE